MPNEDVALFIQDEHILSGSGCAVQPVVTMLSYALKCCQEGNHVK